MSNPTNLPEDVVLDLDALERPERDQKPPFVISLAGRRVTFRDPEEIDWRELLSVKAPADLMRVALSTEDRQHLYDNPIESWKFNELMKRYESHFDLAEKLRKAQLQAQINGYSG